MEKELSMQEREEMQNKAIIAASSLVTSADESGIYQEQIQLACDCVNCAINEALLSVSAISVLNNASGVKERMFVAGVLKQIYDRLQLLCIQK